MISYELHEFCERWFQKARRYNEVSLDECFDRFFSLYIVYNRLYAELALSLARAKETRLPFISDSRAAKDYVQSYLGTNNIWSAIQNDHECERAVGTIRELLDGEVFAIKLDRLRGDPMPDEDRKLLKAIEGNSTSHKVRALLDIVYSIRCNMFHGHKGFDKIQIEILTPVNTLLDKLASLLYEKLSSDYDVGMLPPQNPDRRGWRI